jgi:glyoxylase I family protein
MSAEQAGRGVHHIAIQVGDLERARAFYVDVLGLPLVRTQPHALWVQAGATLVMLERCDGVVDDGPWASPRCGPFVVAFAMTKAERSALVARLAAAGVVVDHESGYSVYLRDPFGARLAFSHYPD